MKKLFLTATTMAFVPQMALAQFIPSWDWDNNADLKFWAPGMGGNFVSLSQVQGGGSGPQFVGNYFAYVIKGISGSLTLGNRNLFDQYWTPTRTYQRAWNGQSSWANFGFQINNERFTDPALFLAVSGTEAGASTGSVTQFLADPIVIRSRGSYDTSITFVPHANAYFLPAGVGISNKTPGGQIVVLADIYDKAPQPTGDLSASAQAVFQGETATIFYSYDQGEDALRESSHTAGGSSPFGISGGGS